MKTTIGRTLFFFKDGRENLVDLNDRFFPLANFLNRLLSEVYDGKKIKFINLDFSTERTYELFPVRPKCEGRSAYGHFHYYGVIDIQYFNKLEEGERARHVWELAYQGLRAASLQVKNLDLYEACEYAYKKGLENGLNPDYRMLETEAVVHGELLKAALWVNFDQAFMNANFTLEKDGTVIFRKFIDKARLGIEFFLIMYKKIEAKYDAIIIKGYRDVKYLPLKITVDAEIVNQRNPTG